jgi:hypothetical protein
LPARPRKSFVFARLFGSGFAGLGALARCVASIEITGTPMRAYNNTLRGLESLPIAIHSNT